ncbi:fertility inhibition FinO-like protein [Leptolyngbya sp. FACHB-261]|uniref:fertility inhibition FinO-like protein n=1 Tax=Leptolyngbya sp. FACHB-261 TaxID=2692806 RepID=UPI001682EB41|nr:fertility inhibition FinO-like protein [Leptolyngbya sp. FACHB-261]MBD2104551.1 fertility inhibition FinO-like protein [Leptolyngbya sp. FACHB-261]
MTIPGRMELTVKISQFPENFKTVENGWKQIQVEVGGKEITIKMRPRMFNKLEKAKAEYPEWIASIAGQMGPNTPKGFILLEPNLQVFERKPRPEVAAASQADAN